MNSFDTMKYLSNILADELDESIVSNMKSRPGEDMPRRSRRMRRINYDSNVSILKKNFPKLTNDEACELLGIELDDLYKDIDLKAIIRNVKLDRIL